MRHQLVSVLAVCVVLGVMSCGDDDSVEDAGADATPAPQCGNNKREGEERCDGTDLDGETCASLGDGSMFTGGTLSCRSTCTFNMSGCRGGDSGMDDMDGGGGGTGG